MRAPSPVLVRLLAYRFASALTVAHVGGLLVLTLALSVEGASLGVPALAERLSTELPPLWASLAAVLSLLGGALGLARLRRDRILLAIGTLGGSPLGAVVVSAVLGALLGGAAGLVPTRELVVSAPTWTRGAGGWIQSTGDRYPDVVGASVADPAVAVPKRPHRIVEGLAAGAVGAVLGFEAGAVPVLLASASWVVGDSVAEGLYSRGAAPGWVLLGPAALGVLVAATRLRGR